MRWNDSIRIMATMSLCGAAIAGAQLVMFNSPAASPAYIADTNVSITDEKEVGAGDPASPLHIERTSNGLFYVDGRINGHKLRFAIDTGASAVVLNAADAKRVGLGQNYRWQDRIRTASGTGRMSWRTAERLEIAGKSIGPTDIAVMENGPEISLLGLSALTKLDRVTIRNDGLTIE